MSIKQIVFDFKKYMRIKYSKPMYLQPLEYRIKKDMEVFERTFGYKFDIYNPSSFVEKVHTYKLLYSNPQISKIVDKYAFKSYITEQLGDVGFVAKAYGIYSSIDELKQAWEALPEEFVLKSTISSDGKNIIFVKNKSEMNSRRVFKEIEEWFDPRNTLLNSFSLGYYDCKPRVLAEEYLHVINEGGNLKDYKFFCFDGKVRFVYTTARTFIDSQYPRTFFDTDWNKMDVSFAAYPTAETAEKPIHFNEMIEICEKLSRDFPFVRMDFYDSEEMPILGEMTFYPNGGFMSIEPKSFDIEIGKEFIIPEQNLLRKKI